MNKEEEFKNILRIIFAGMLLLFIFLLLTTNNYISHMKKEEPQQKAEISMNYDNVAVINYELIFRANPKIQEAYKKMNDYYVQLQQANAQAPMTPEKMKELDADLKNKEKEIIDPIKQDIKKNIEQALAEKNLKIVFDKKALIFGGQDITKDVLLKSGISADEVGEILKNNE